MGFAYALIIFSKLFVYSGGVNTAVSQLFFFFFSCISIERRNMFQGWRAVQFLRVALNCIFRRDRVQYQKRNHPTA